MKVRCVARIRKEGKSSLVTITDACKILGIRQGETVFITVERGPTFNEDEDKIYNRGLEIFE